MAACPSASVGCAVLWCPQRHVHLSAAGVVAACRLPLLLAISCGCGVCGYGWTGASCWLGCTSCVPPDCTCGSRVCCSCCCPRGVCSCCCCYCPRGVCCCCCPRGVCLSLHLLHMCGTCCGPRPSNKHKTTVGRWGPVLSGRVGTGLFTGSFL